MSKGSVRPDGSSRRKRTVGYLLFEGVQLMDVAGPYDVLGRARLPQKNDSESALFHNVTIAENSIALGAENGLTFTPEYTFENHPPLDILVVPGGPGMAEQRRNRRVIGWIASASKSAEITAGVCTGAFLLAEAGLLHHKRATTYWQRLSDLSHEYPDINVIQNVRFVDEGHIVTSAGISAGIDMALNLVLRLHGPEIAGWSARRIEYAYRPQPLSSCV
jgi:transcriptional regulator GlxA family with amidase domain